MNSVKIDSRAMFRLHALDLWAAAQPTPETHWMLRRECALRSWLAVLARDYGRLRRAGGDPFEGRPITARAVIRQLGLECCDEPSGFWDQLKFTARMLAVARRERFRVQRETIRLQNYSRCQR